MGRTGTIAAILAMLTFLQGATRGLPMGDARRGRELFQSRRCVACHSANGQGGTNAPDLARAVERGFSPYHLAASLWNHAPRMWSALKSKNIPFPELSEQDGADLFVYFYSIAFFNAPSDARQGGALFRGKQCASCHGIDKALPGGAPAVSSWQALDNPVIMAQRMWNHSSGMRVAIEKGQVPYPTLSAQELTDILTFLRRRMNSAGPRAEFVPGPPDTGLRLLVLKGCAGCHSGSRALDDRPTRYTLIDFTAAMWNHAYIAGKDTQLLTPDDMGDIIGYIMAAQFLRERGDFDQGRRVFEDKQCGRCHDDSSSQGPPLSKMTGRMSSLGIISAVSRHGPLMMESLQRAGSSWPHVTALEMADLTTYLNGLVLKRRAPVTSGKDGREAR